MRTGFPVTTSPFPEASLFDGLDGSREGIGGITEIRLAAPRSFASDPLAADLFYLD
jgi:hypothetical protein